jgi:hypothetical protein
VTAGLHTTAGLREWAERIDLSDLQRTVDHMRTHRAKRLAQGRHYPRDLDKRLLMFASVLRDRTDQQKRTAREESLRAIKKG